MKVFESTGQFLDPIKIQEVFDDVPRYYGLVFTIFLDKKLVSANFERHLFNPGENPKYLNVSRCIKQGLEKRAQLRVKN